MRVSKILERKGTHVVVVEPTDSVCDLTQLLRRRGIGAAVVVGEGGALAGIVTERDVLYAIAARGRGVFHMQVRDLMTTMVATCGPDDDVKHVMVIMTHRRVRHLPVIDNGTLAGIVSIGDVVKGRLEENELEINVLRDYARARVARPALAGAAIHMV